MFRNIHALIVSIILAGLSTFAYGQDAQVQGQVVDTTGAGIPKALVRIVDQQTSTERKMETNETGQYTVVGLTSGIYKIVVEAPGFSTSVSDQVHLESRTNAVLNFTLQVTSTSANVVVTAEKRDERIMDVPISMTSISAENLMSSGPLRLQDYTNQVPGLISAPGAYDQSTLAIRGITTGQGGNRTVGVLIGDMPYGSPTNIGAGDVIPDFDPNDLVRVEVLRGPQGTLYGASSMGGLIKFVPVEPSLERISGQFQMGTDTVHNGAEPGYNFRGSLNLPLSHTLATRLTGFTRREPGYIDNVATGQHGVNDQYSSGTSLSGLWHLSDVSSLKMGGIFQYSSGNGVNEAQPSLGDLKQSYVAGVGPWHRTLQIYDVDLKTKFHGIDMTAVSGYNINIDRNVTDYTYKFASFAQKVFGVTGSPFLDNWRNGKFTQEVRFAGTFKGKVDWLAGVYYTDERSGLNEYILAADPKGSIVGVGVALLHNSTYEEYAGFANVTYHATERFDIQAGIRESGNQQSLVSTTVGPYDPLALGAPSPIIYPNEYTNDRSFTFLVTPRYRFSSNWMAYGRIASGYRPGSPNLNGVSFPAEPDTTVNYEIGTKGDFWHHKLSLDASLYYVDWNNIQIQIKNPVTAQTGIANGGTAKSEGIELAATVRPIAGLTISGWVAPQTAVLTEALPGTTTVPEPSGSRLPEAARFTGNISVDEGFQIHHGVQGFIGGTYIYVGPRYGLFHTPRDYYPSYMQANIRAGLGYKSYSLYLYGYNIADERGVLSGGQEATNPNAFIYLQPRTVGINLSKRF